MSHATSQASEPSRLSRIIHRTSLMSPIAIFRQRRESSTSLATINTLLPQYSPSDPRPNYTESDNDESSSNLPSPELEAPEYTRNAAANEQIVLRTSRSDFSANIQQRKVDTFSFPVKQVSKPWVTLHLYSPIMQDSIVTHRPTHPRVYGGKPFEGIVELDVIEPIPIQEIKLTITGDIVSDSTDLGVYTFLDHSITLWKLSANDTLTQKLNLHSNGKFSGYHDLSFSFIFPTEVNTDCLPLMAGLGGVPCPYPLAGQSNPSSPTSLQNSTQHQSAHRFGTQLPPTFLERNTNASIRYKAILRLYHGRFRSDTRIGTTIVYVPTITPPALPLGIRLAYRSASNDPTCRRRDNHSVVIPSPLSDPSSWLALKMTTLHGVVSNSQKPFVVNCTPYIAQPLSYTSGFIIPCFISVSGDDPRVLDMLSSPSCPSTRLVQKISYISQAAPFNPESCHNYSESVLSHGESIHGALKLPAAKPVPHRSSYTRELAAAVWWKPSKEVEQHSFCRSLAGEIHLPRGLPPTSACSFFNIEYYVEVLPFRAHGYVFEGTTGDVLATQLIEIASTHSPGDPTPIPFTQAPNPHSRR